MRLYTQCRRSHSPPYLSMMLITVSVKVSHPLLAWLAGSLERTVRELQRVWYFSERTLLHICTQQAHVLRRSTPCRAQLIRSLFVARSARYQSHKVAEKQTHAPGARIRASPRSFLYKSNPTHILLP